MALRFRKSIKLAPGVRMNFSGSGMGMSLGPRGASIGIGRRGTYLNTGIPGTGISARHRLSSSNTPRKPASKAQEELVTITAAISDDGELSFTDANGQPISEAMLSATKRQQGEKIRQLIQGKCDQINERIEALGRIHEFTSPPRPHEYQPQPFIEPKPSLPIPKQPGFFCKLFKSCVTKVEASNQLAIVKHAEAVAAWEQRKESHVQEEASRANLVLQLNSGNWTMVEDHFEEVLHDITWPRETDVAFEMPSPGVFAIDVDLPEIEDMPNKTASVPQRGLKLSVKEMGPTQVQKLYMSHVHAIGFRIAGEAFSASPKVQTVILSAFTQRTNKATGHIEDQYLYSVKISRERWIEIDFDNLPQVDVIEAMSRFELRRDMSKTGVFKSIAPFNI